MPLLLVFIQKTNVMFGKHLNKKALSKEQDTIRKNSNASSSKEDGVGYYSSMFLGKIPPGQEKLNPKRLERQDFASTKPDANLKLWSEKISKK